MGLKSFRDLIPRCSVIRLRTDSMVALGVMRAGSSRSPTLLAEMRELYELIVAMGVELGVEHTSSVLNDWADRLSREHDTTDWTLAAATYDRLSQQFGRHSVDLFTT